MAVKQITGNLCVKTVFPVSTEIVVKISVENVRLAQHATLHPVCVQMDARTTGYFLIVQNVNRINMDLTVQPSVATVKAEAPALWIRGIVPVDAHTVGSGNAVIYSAVMVLTSRVKVVSSVKVCVRTAHLVISQPENVMTGVVYIGLGHIVKNVRMDILTKIAAAHVVIV